MIHSSTAFQHSAPTLGTPFSHFWFSLNQRCRVHFSLVFSSFLSLATIVFSKLGLSQANVVVHQELKKLYNWEMKSEGMIRVRPQTGLLWTSKSNWVSAHDCIKGHRALTEELSNPFASLLQEAPWLLSPALSLLPINRKAFFAGSVRAFDW